MNTQNFSEICRLRHDLHSHPELSMHEKETKRRLMEFLQTHTCLEIVDRGLWFYACYHAPDSSGKVRTETGSPDQLPDNTLGTETSSPDQLPGSTLGTETGSPDQLSGGTLGTETGSPVPNRNRRTGLCTKPPIAFRAEFDAIPVNETLDLPYCSVTPGVSHKCGHDGHASILAGLALEVSNRLISAGSIHEINNILTSHDGFTTSSQALSDCAASSQALSGCAASSQVLSGCAASSQALSGCAASSRILSGCTSLPDRDIYFIFQHAEETGQGGEPCSALIREKGIGEVYACHNMSGWPKGSIVLRNGTMWCASKGLRIHFTGKASHASLPEDGVSPVIPVSQLAAYAAAPVPEGRYEKMVLSTVVGIRVGNEDFGVSPGEGTLALTLRGEREEEMLDREMDIRNRAHYLAEAYSPEGRPPMKVTFSETDVFPETGNDAACADRVRNAASRLGLAVIDMPDPVRSSEDFGWFTKACPGASFLIGTGEDYPAIHTPEFDYPDELMPEVVDLFMALI